MPRESRNNLRISTLGFYGNKHNRVCFSTSKHICVWTSSNTKHNEILTRLFSFHQTQTSLLNCNVCTKHKQTQTNTNYTHTRLVCFPSPNTCAFANSCNKHIRVCNIFWTNTIAFVGLYPKHMRACPQTWLLYGFFPTHILAGSIRPWPKLHGSFCTACMFSWFCVTNTCAFNHT